MKASIHTAVLSLVVLATFCHCGVAPKSASEERASISSSAPADSCPTVPVACGTIPTTGVNAGIDGNPSFDAATVCPALCGTQGWTGQSSNLQTCTPAQACSIDQRVGGGGGVEGAAAGLNKDGPTGLGLNWQHVCNCGGPINCQSVDHPPIGFAGPWTVDKKEAYTCGAPCCTSVCYHYFSNTDNAQLFGTKITDTSTWVVCGAVFADGDKVRGIEWQDSKNNKFYYGDVNATRICDGSGPEITWPSPCYTPFTIGADPYATIGNMGIGPNQGYDKGAINFVKFTITPTSGDRKDFAAGPGTPIPYDSDCTDRHLVGFTGAIRPYDSLLGNNLQGPYISQLDFVFTNQIDPPRTDAEVKCTLF